MLYPDLIQGPYADGIIEGHAKAESDANIWSRYDSDVSSTEDLFEPVLDGETLQNLASKLKSKFGRLQALDLMGQGSRLVELGVDQGMAVSLGINIRDMRKGIDRSKLTYLAGDAMIPQTWSLIQKWTSEHGKFGFILCTPHDGSKYAWAKSDDDRKFNVDDDAHLFNWIIEQCTENLSEAGVLLIESESSRRVLPRWLGSNQYKDNPTPIDIKVNPVLAVAKIIRKPSLEITSIKVVSRQQHVNHI